MKSIQGPVNAVNAVKTMIGLDNGSVILVKICHLVAPSNIALSSNEYGIVSKNPFWM